MRCFVCDKDKSSKKMHPEPIVGKNVCASCYSYLGMDSWITPEREILLLIQSDDRGRTDPSRSSGGRFKRHKG